MSGDRTLVVSDLVAFHAARRTLGPLSLAALSPGTVMAVVGPNGAGKSTLLRAIAGVLRAEGQVLLGGIDILRQTPRHRAAHIGFMPQMQPHGMDLTVLDSVISAMMTMQPPPHPHAAAARAVEVLERLGALELSLKRLDQVSGGQRQMAGLAQALARDPEVLLLDEPTSSLDLRHQHHVLATVRRLAGAGRIVIVVLHDLSLAVRWADRIAVVRQGRLYAEGTPGAVITPAMLREVYGVDAAVEADAAGGLQVIVRDLAGPAPAVDGPLC